ncbi:ankyrin repeat domain-containing protein [Polaribacter sp. MSW13]|uniref:Ankyrin repeat domain-containing protein n=1 Tax=Polaribacter marinus TaxID=2916838 RepID=A0A9X1VQI4_9FLAO|nr:ankyrin repeat domain-containing protein [Polaribacter marinus]MCI2230451.1 ankyrin repeat domain-containing protein [Polaribacter marinus]
MARAGRLLKVESELEFIDSYVEKNDFDGINMLTKSHGIDCYDSYKRTFLILASSKGNESILNYIIEKGADIDFQDKNGFSALHFASQNNEIGIIEILLNKGANPNVRDFHGNPPIWTAIMNAREDFSIVKKLLEKNADIQTKNNHGKSPKEMWNLRFNDEIESLLK